MHYSVYLLVYWFSNFLDSRKCVSRLTVSLGVSFSEYFSCCELSYFRYTVNDKRGLRGSNWTSVGYGNNRAFPNDKVISFLFKLSKKKKKKKKKKIILPAAGTWHILLYVCNTYSGFTLSLRTGDVYCTISV